MFYSQFFAQQVGHLTVFAGVRQHPDHPLQLDFHFARGTQAASHWHGLLQGRTLFLDVPHLVLDLNSRESLIATLEYVEEETEAGQVMLNFHRSRQDRGDLLRAFSFLGFELVRPDHPDLPPWENMIFMAYPMERELGHEGEGEAETPEAGAASGQDRVSLANGSPERV